MKKIFLMLVLAVSLSFSGCSLIPKRVEFFQDKVQKFPEPPPAQTELQRQAAQRATEKAREALEAALYYHTPTEVTAPAKETEVLTDAVAESVGPPLHPSTDDSSTLATGLRSARAKLSREIDDFKEGNDKNAGKKIEGTGLFSVPYFVWAGGFVALIVGGYFVLKLALSAGAAVNPGAAVGLGALNVASSVVSKGFHQIVQGGEQFKDWVETEISDTGVKEKILKAFAHSHVSNQDQDVQAVVKQITK